MEKHPPKVVLSAALAVGLMLLGCTGDGDYRAFVHAHDALRPGMTLGQAFGAGLADYLMRLGTKNVPGATLAGKQPVSDRCRRYVVDIARGSATFSVFVYCDMNAPGSPQLTPMKSFTNKQDFLRALETDYVSWAQSMSFRVESPPRRLLGVYDSYEFTTDADARVATISAIIRAR